MKSALELWVNEVPRRGSNDCRHLSELKGISFHAKTLNFDSYIGWLGFTRGYAYISLACPIDAVA